MPSLEVPTDKQAPPGKLFWVRKSQTGAGGTAADFQNGLGDLDTKYNMRTPVNGITTYV